MASRAPGPKDRQQIDRILGYLNFSSGSPDPQFLASCNELFQRLDQDAAAWRSFLDLLRDELPRLQQRSDTFANISQAQGVLRLLRDSLLPAYRAFPRRSALPPDGVDSVPPLLSGPRV